MLEDGFLDDEESAELFGLLKMISGDGSEVGELAKSSSLPLDLPLPLVTFPDSKFLFTGTCAYGTRKQCHEITESLGGVVQKRVTKSLNYLVLGTYVTDSWIHENYGRKIEKAMSYRNEGVPILIISEEHWADSGRIA